jgi:hypothetical protein
MISMRYKEIVRPVVLAIALIVSTYEVLHGPGRALNIAGALVLAVTLFSIRKHHRVSYGIIEIAFGCFGLWYTWREGRGAISSDFSADFDVWMWRIIVIQTVGAVYVIIRGLDNIDQGSLKGKATNPYVVRMHAICRGLLART